MDHFPLKDRRIINQLVVDHETFFYILHFIDLEIYEEEIHQCDELESGTYIQSWHIHTQICVLIHWQAPKLAQTDLMLATNQKRQKTLYKWSPRPVANVERKESKALLSQTFAGRRTMEKTTNGDVGSWTLQEKATGYGRYTNLNTTHKDKM